MFKVLEGCQFSFDKINIRGMTENQRLMAYNQALSEDPFRMQPMARTSQELDSSHVTIEIENERKRSLAKQMSHGMLQHVEFAGVHLVLLGALYEVGNLIPTFPQSHLRY